MRASMHIKKVSLTGIFEFWFVLVLIDVSMLSYERMFVFELVRTLLAEAIGLSWECAYSNVGVEGSTFGNKFENMSILKWLHWST